jgi:hypothetical protein
MTGIRFLTAISAELALLLCVNKDRQYLRVV